MCLHVAVHETNQNFDMEHAFSMPAEHRVVLHEVVGHVMNSSAGMASSSVVGFVLGVSFLSS